MSPPNLTHGRVRGSTTVITNGIIESNNISKKPTINFREYCCIATLNEQGSSVTIFETWRLLTFAVSEYGDAA